jgi:hypothetical protein
VIAVLAVVLLFVVIGSGQRYRTSGNLQLIHDPIVRGAGQWVEQPALAQQFPHALAVLDGNLYGVEKSAQDRSLGLTYFDGNITRVGAKIPTGAGNWGASLWPDTTGSDIYGPVSDTVVWVTGSVTAGAFVAGESCTQTNSSATGLYIRTDASLGIVLQLTAGTFTKNVADTIVGSGTWTPDDTGLVTDVRTILHFVDDPTNNAAESIPVIEGGDKGGLPGIFIDCGVITGLSSKQTLLWIATDDTETSYLPQIWYNHPADNTTWTQIFAADANAIKHWHGGQVIRDVNGVSGSHVLLVYTGDVGADISILYCDDIADFVNNGATWKTNWGLDLADAARTAYFNTAAGAAFTVGHSEQRFRGILAAVDTDERYAYYIPDSPSESTVNCQKIDLVNKTTTALTNLNIPGAGHMAVTLSNGAMLLEAFSTASSGTYLGTSDKYLRLYCVDETRNGLKLIWARERGDSDDPRDGSQWFLSLLEYPAGDTSVDLPATVWMDATHTPSNPKGGTVVGNYFPRGLGHQSVATQGILFTGSAYSAEMPVLNLLKNGRFSDSNFGEWTIANSNRLEAMAQEGTEVDVLGGNVKSLKLTPKAGEAGDAYIEYQLPDDIVEMVRGHWVTAHVRGLWETGAIGSRPDIRLSDGANLAGAVVRPLVSVADDWYTMESEVFIPSGATVLKLRISARASGSGTDVQYFSDVSLTMGCNAGRMPPNLPPNTVPFTAIFSSDTAPPAPLFDGLMWLDTNAGGADGTLFIYSDGAWQTILDLNI